MNEVETFIDQLSAEWQKQKCRTLLGVQQDTNSSVVSAIKWGNPYFSYNGKALLKWYCANNWINVYFFRGIELDDPEGLFTDTDNKKMRTIKIYDETEINREAYAALIKQAVLLNR